MREPIGMGDLAAKSAAREQAWGSFRATHAQAPASEAAAQAFGRYIDADEALRQAREIAQTTGRRIRAFSGKLR